MRENDLVKTKDGIFRILTVDEERMLAINCGKKTMPKYINVDYFKDAEIMEGFPTDFPTMNDLSPADRKIAQERHTMISGVVSVVDDLQRRNLMIEYAAKQFYVSKQSIRASHDVSCIYTFSPKTTSKRRREGFDYKRGKLEKFDVYS